MYQYGIASAKGKDALRQRKSYKMISINIIETRFFLGAGYACFLEISPSALKTSAYFAGYNWRIEKVQSLQSLWSFHHMCYQALCGL